MTLTSKERMAIPRQKMPEQEVSRRVGNFDEVPLGYTLELAQMEARRCIQCKKPTCVAGCPVEIDIPAFIKFIEEGDLKGSIRKMKETNILPAMCGRVCPQEDQCEKVCILARKYAPVAIGYIERIKEDWERESGEIEIPDLAPDTGKRVAVVGSGPAGLTVAADLRKMGHGVTLFEALHKPGGVLVYGIPEFRLPKDIVRSEIEILKKMGVEIKVNYVVGKIKTVDELLEEFDAVFLGTGAGLPWFMFIPGENLSGIYSANEYLTRSNLMRAFEFPGVDTPIARGGRVAVVGGGNVAMDSARTALRLGAEKVYLIYRRSRKEMPARIEEIQRAEEEGVEFHLLSLPLRYEGDDKGWVREVVCQRMELGEPDASGRRRPVPIPGSEYTLKINCAVVAIGNGPNPLVPATTPGLETTKRGTIIADEETGRTTKKGVFAGGDIVIGAATVILAMGAGRRAAKAIHSYITTGGW